MAGAVAHRRILVFGAAIFVVALVSSGSMAPARQLATTYLHEPTLIGATIVQGPVVFVHDDDKKARGEPCTSIYIYEPGKGAAEEITSFHCIRKTRPAAAQFTVRTRPNWEVGFGMVLVEYQFAGETHAHAVPTEEHAHVTDSAPGRE
jgi:hypothetical protein